MPLPVRSFLRRSIYFLSVLILITSGPAYAIKIVSIKKNRALLDLEQERFSIGDKLVATSTKTNQIINFQILKIKANKAIAIVESGKPEKPLDQYSFKSITAVNPPAIAIQKTLLDKVLKIRGSSYGGLVGYARNSVDVKLVSTIAVGMSGDGLNLSGFYQRPLSDRYELQGSVGYNSVKVSSQSAPTSLCGGNSCFVNAGYLDLQALLKYKLPFDAAKIWVGLGFDLLFAVTKESNILDAASFETQQKFAFATGTDFKLKSMSFIPLAFEYGIFINKNAVSVNQMILRSGYGVYF